MITLDQGGRGRPFATILRPPRGLEHLVEHATLLRTAGAPPGRSWRVVPDAAPHLIFFRLRDGDSVASLVGPRSRYIDVSHLERAFTVGVRLRPGALPVVASVDAWDLRDRALGLGEAFGRRGRAVMARARSLESPRAIADALMGLLARHHTASIDWRAAGLVAELETARGPRGPRVREVARDLSVGERTLRDAVRRTVGLRPKEADRITRLHRCLADTLAGRPDARAAYRSGYADQAHFIRECRSLLGETPGAFRSRGAVSFKTGGSATGDRGSGARTSARATSRLGMGGR